jgi:hypothetical protein
MGVAFAVNVPAHLHISQNEALKNKPSPLQVVARITNQTDQAVSWTVPPESMHFWKLTNSDDSIVDCGNLIKPRDKFVSGIIVTLQPRESIETEPLVGIAPSKLKASSKYFIHYMFCGLEGKSELVTD